MVRLLNEGDLETLHSDCKYVVINYYTFNGKLINTKCVDLIIV